MSLQHVWLKLDMKVIQGGNYGPHGTGCERVVVGTRSPQPVSKQHYSNPFLNAMGTALKESGMGLLSLASLCFICHTLARF